METFIVLGLCFILYEALDLFQSCYNKERHQQQQHQRQQEHSSDGACSSSGRAGSSTDCIAANNNNNCSGSDSYCVNKDTAHLMPLDSIEEIDLDSDDNQSTHLNKSKVYSICDRVINQHFDNNNVCVDESEKLIVG